MKSHLHESLNCLLWMFLPSLWLKKTLKLYLLKCTTMPYFKYKNPHHVWRIFWDLPFIKPLYWLSLSVNTFIMVNFLFEISPSRKPKLLTLNDSTFTMHGWRKFLKSHLHETLKWLTLNDSTCTMVEENIEIVLSWMHCNAWS